jgi:hypothetical protein
MVEVSSGGCRQPGLGCVLGCTAAKDRAQAASFSTMCFVTC